VALLPEIFAYKVPPLKSAEGYKAQDWNATGCIWKGTAFIMSNGTDVCVLKMENETGIFLETPISGKTLIPTLDSSRYFVLSIPDPSNKSKNRFLGIGFSKESNLAFEFLAALQSQKQKSEDLKAILETGKDFNKDQFKLKEGETISLSLPVSSQNSTTGTPATNVSVTTTSSDIASFSFAPPPKQRGRQQPQ